MTTIQQFDHDYQQLRELVIKGRLTSKEAKDWIRARGFVVAEIADDERAIMIKKQCSKRVDLDVPILEEEEK